MSNSSLVNYTHIVQHKNSPRNHAIDTVTIHCVVGQVSVESLGNIFDKRGCSANYGIGTDGRIGLYCDEGDRSWCSSSASNDNRAITIECASDATHPYAVNDKVMESLINLLVDICKRNGIDSLKWCGDKSLIGQVDKQNMTVHRWFANKACPGEYLYNKHGEIASKVNARLHPVDNVVKYKVQVGAFKSYQNAVNMRERVKSAGYSTAYITQSGVFYKVQVGAFANKDNALRLQNELKAKGFDTLLVDLTSGVAPQPVNNVPYSEYSDMELARMVLRGELGNGAERKAKLGSRYSAVQKIVNTLI